MNKPNRRALLKALIALPFMSVLDRAAEASEAMPAFEAGEKLKYKLGWQFITAGHATLEVQPDEEFDGRKVRCFSMTAKTGKAADQVFKVRDKLSSVTEYDVSRSVGFTKIQREGKTKRDVTVDFDWVNMKANYFDGLNGSTRSVDIQPNTLDPLSAFYFVRRQKLEVGKEFSGPITDGKRCKIAKISVTKRKRIKVNGKKHDAFCLIPDIQDVGGVFEKSKDAKMEIWCTADHRHIPILMKSKVLVGSFKAELDSEI